MNLIALFMALVVLTNMVTNIVKGWGGVFAKRPQIVAVVVAELLTLGAAVAYIQHMAIAAVWYHYAGGAVAGLVVGYVSMYGYDSLYEDLVKYLKGLVKGGDAQ